jgi:hypothetical protein
MSKEVDKLQTFEEIKEYYFQKAKRKHTGNIDGLDILRMEIDADILARIILGARKEAK